jgi:4-azaleucine resistance transporter AzlC
MGSFWRTLDRATLRDIALVCLADAVVGASFGAITVSGGLPEWLPVAMSLLIFAGGAQFAAAGVMLAGGGPAAAILAGLVLNTRLFPYGLAVPDVLGDTWLARLAGAHVLTDESVAFALRQPDRARRRAAFWTCGVGLFATWNLAVAAGMAAGRLIGNAGAIGLDAVFPAVLVALVMPALADRGVRDAALVGAATAVAASVLLPAGIPLLLSLSGLVLTLPRCRCRSDDLRPARIRTRPRAHGERGAGAGRDGKAAEGRLWRRSWSPRWLREHTFSGWPARSCTAGLPCRSRCSACWPAPRRCCWSRWPPPPRWSRGMASRAGPGLPGCWSQQC